MGGPTGQRLRNAQLYERDNAVDKGAQLRREVQPQLARGPAVVYALRRAARLFWHLRDRVLREALLLAPQPHNSSHNIESDNNDLLYSLSRGQLRFL